jgi:hypothetical protein
MNTLRNNPGMRGAREPVGNKPDEIQAPELMGCGYVAPFH